MSQSQYSGSKGYVATSAISGAGYAVKLSSGEVVVATAGTDAIIGVTEQKCEAGEVVSVRLRSAQGTAKGKAGGNVSIGSKLTATTGGKLIATTTAGDEVVGVAIESAVSNDVFEFIPSNSNLYAA